MQLERFRQPELVKKLALSIIVVLVLSAGFYSNCWHVAEQQQFLQQSTDTESLIIGRMVKSRQDGIFSVGGLAGAGMENDLHRDWITKEQRDYQYEAYLNGLTFDAYSPYMSQIGAEGMLFSLLDGLLPLLPQTKLELFHLLTSLLSAIALTLVILWFHGEFGLGVALVVAASMFLSQWLTLFGRNLWWSLWAFYAPLIALLYFLRHRRGNTNRYLIKLGVVACLSVFVKCLFNGFEYITTTLIMAAVPFVYYAIMDRLTARQFLKGALAVMAGASLAVLLSVIILSFQIAAVKGSVLAGFEHVVYSLGLRTYGGAAAYPKEYTAGPQSTTMGVLATYLQATFFDLNNYVKTSHTRIARFVFNVRYAYLIALFALMSLVAVYGRNNSIAAGQRQQTIALVSATWFSILAPLSWLVIFKDHSFIHTHMNPIVWQMPFTLFGFAVCGLALKRIITQALAPDGGFT